MTAAVPPRGAGWLHEILIDGIRVQLHKSGGRVVVYGFDGQDLTGHLPDLRQNLLSLPVRSAIIDAVVVARNGNIKLGVDAFLAKAHTRCCCWCFDLLECDGVDLRMRKLVERKARLQELISDDHLFRYCDEIRDPAKALAVSERMGLAGTVSRRADQPYRSGRNPDWVEVMSGAPRMPVIAARQAAPKPRTTVARRPAPRRSLP